MNDLTNLADRDLLWILNRLNGRLNNAPDGAYPEMEAERTRIVIEINRRGRRDAAIDR